MTVDTVGTHSPTVFDAGTNLRSEPDVDDREARVDAKHDSPTPARRRAGSQRTAHPCGCKSGAALTVIALLGWPIWMCLSPSVRTLGDVIVAVVAYPCVIVAAGVIGKVAGIAVGTWWHRRVQRQLTHLADAR
jgi:hypothetical protein